jgi:hypothetical protein
MSTIIALVAFALLFGLAAALRPRAGCSHDCGACGHTCIDRQEHT